MRLTLILLLIFFLGLSNAAFSQATVRGNVADNEGDALPGATVMIKGTNIGTTTDFDGNYTINIESQDAVLVFSFIGLITQEIEVGNRTQINISLKADVRGLEEVVVVGYGTVKKSDITGALSSVSSEDLNEMPVYNVNQALQGRAAGVDIVNTGFGANSSPMVRVRGNRSIKANNDPMYIIDGIPVEAGINEINPMDVESIEVLKDASSTAIYGSRAANGVIIITTKRGKTGQVSVNYEGSIGFETPLVKFPLTTGHEWTEVYRDLMRGAGRYAPSYSDPVLDKKILSRNDPVCWESVKMGYEWEDYENEIVKMRPTTTEEQELWGVDQVPVYDPSKVRTYDWESEGLQTGITHNHQFSVSGGTETLRAMFSVGYIDRTGIEIGQSYQRVSPRLNLDFQPLPWLKIGMSSSFSSSKNDPGHGLYGGVASQIPLTMPYDSEGNFIMLPFNSAIENPLRDNILNTAEEITTRFLGSYYAEISFLRDFKYRINIGQDSKHRGYGQFEDANSTQRYGNPNWARYRTWQDLNWTVENLLFFDKEIGVHKIGVTLLQSAGAKKYEYTRMEGQDYPYTSQLWHKMQSLNDPTLLDLESDYRREQIASFMGRVNYNLLDKYLLTATLRYDGTSKFYDDPNELLENNWDYFPSVAAAWKASDEAFLQDVSAISQLKLRLGYGTTGQSGTNPYETDGTIKESFYVFGEEPAKGYTPDKIATRDVGWEKTTSTNLGVDFGFFENRVSGSIELYNNNTHDLLLDKAIPSVTGYSIVRANIGEVNNKGIELTLNTININNAGFVWESNLTFSKNEEKIVELYGNGLDDLVNNWFIGHPINSYYSYKFDRIWQLKDAEEMLAVNEASGKNFKAGQIKVVDVNNDGVIDENDRTVVGHNVPKFTGGFTNRLSYKGFTLSAFLYFRVGQGIYNRDTHSPVQDGLNNVRFNVHYYSLAATEEENATATHPMPSLSRDPYYEAIM
jgi:TonB-linked SusC/RagA family outer membrane protein